MVVSTVEFVKIYAVYNEKVIKLCTSCHVYVVLNADDYKIILNASHKAVQK